MTQASQPAPVLKGEARKEDILRKAAHVFLELGYDATSMNVIAERAGVTKPGLYYHYQGKQELLFEIMSSAMDALERETGQAAARATSSEERLRGIISAHARLMAEDEDGALTILVIDETKALRDPDRSVIDDRKRAYVETIRQAIEALATEGKVRSVDSTLAAFTLLGMVLWLTKWYQRGGRLGGRKVADQITEMAMASILA